MGVLAGSAPRTVVPSGGLVPHRVRLGAAGGTRCQATGGDSGSSGGGKILTPDGWKQKARQRARAEVSSAGGRLGLKPAYLEEKLDVLESLLPNMAINLDQLKASDWAKIVSDAELPNKVITIKMAFPGLNVESLLTKHPKVLLWSMAVLQDNLTQVCRVLHQLPRPDLVLEVLPEILDPKQCLSVVATLRKWYPKRNPLEVLQTDPEVVLRAERCDVPLEPVFYDTATQQWTAAGYSRQQQEEWQVYIETEIYKRKPQPIDQQSAVVITPMGSSGASGGQPLPAPTASRGGGSDAQSFGNMLG